MTRPDATLPKPDHLGREYAEQFHDASVVAAYHHRPPYPDEVFEILFGLIADEPRAVLDVGTGSGAIARALAPRVARVDAVDPSRGMIEKGRGLPGGDHPHLVWIEGYAEDAPLAPPYALITAGASLHWMDWPVVMPRFRDALTPRGVLAMIDPPWLPNPWDDGVLAAINRYSTNRRYRPYDLIDELELRGLFRVLGRQRAAPAPFRQPVADYVESIHSQNGFSRDRMSPENAAAFDREVTRLVSPHAEDGVLTLQVGGEVIWGLPGRAS